MLYPATFELRCPTSHDTSDRIDIFYKIFDAYSEINEKQPFELLQCLSGSEFVAHSNSFLLDGKVSNDQLFHRYYGQHIFAVDLEELRIALEQYNLYRHVKVRRVLPGSIVIDTVKREPIAIFYHNNNRYLIDKEGTLISMNERDLQYFASKVKLEVFGECANIHLSSLLDQFHDFPDLAEKIRMVRRVGNRRWDICFIQEIVAKMPEEHDEFLERLKYLDSLHKQNKLFDCGYAILDFRDSKCYVSKKQQLIKNKNE